MKNAFETKKQPIIRILISGLVILVACLLVCFTLVAALKRSYEKIMENYLYEVHGSVTSVINDIVESTDNIAYSCAVKITDHKYTLDEERIQNVLGMVEGTGYKFNIKYYSKAGIVYTSTKAYGSREATEKWIEYASEFPKIASKPYINIYQDKSTTTLVIVRAVIKSSNLKGYVVVEVDLDGVFSNTAFDSVLKNGELFIIDKDGETLYKSNQGSNIVNGYDNLYKSLDKYCVKTKELNKKMKKEILSQYEGYLQYTTTKGYKMQVAYTPLSVMNDAGIVTCFKENYVGQAVQPAIYRSTLSCIVIMVLMISIILYVWSSAKNANMAIEKMAYEDSVTKGKNINYFKEFSNYVMSVYKETPFVIYRFDISNFRYINEAYGHKRADEVLSACINIFADIFSDKELCVRMNADQFLAIIVNDKYVQQKMDQLLIRVNEQARGYGIKYPIKFKTGIYQIRKHDHDIDIMIDHANVARKSLSGDEKDSTMVYSEKIVNDMRKIDKIESEMQHALASGEFKVYIQPKWDIGSNTICGGEALVRWIKPDGTMVYPDEFIPIFENNGFIEKLDYFMLEKVCESMRQAMNERRAIYPLSVNQSRVFLHSPDYVENVSKIIKNYDIPAGYVELEITETVFDDEKNQMINTLHTLRKVGLRFAMDDFGSGYSSLNILKEIPFDIIKIDKEFFSESVTGDNTRWILQKIIEMVNGLGKELVCEGVETKEQSDMLSGMGCRVVQGYYYSKPIELQTYIDTYCKVYT